jgi:carboxypeptidase family protein
MERRTRLALLALLLGAFAVLLGPTGIEARAEPSRLPGAPIGGVAARMETIAGVVLDEAGRGIPGAEVSAVAYLAEETPRGTAVTGPDGSFVIEGLSSGVHVLVAKAPGYSTEALPRVQTGERSATIALTRLRSVAGRVYDAASERGLSSFRLEARSVPPEGSVKYLRTGLQQTHAGAEDGQFVFDCLKPGRFVLLAQADGYAQHYSPEFEVARGSETPFLRIALTEGGCLVGRVVDGRKGRGIAGVTVTTRDNDFRDDAFAEIFRQFLVTNVSSANVHSVGDGIYVIDHLMAGTYQVEIEHPSFTKECVKDLAVQQGKETRVPDVSLFPGATLRGLVVDAAGAPAAKADVTVRTSASYRAGKPPLCRTRTDPDGRFVARHLPAGEYVVAASPCREEISDPFIVVHDWPTRATVLLDEGADVEVRIVFGR